MSDFMIYTHRLERAGIRSLWISLGSDADGYRLMHVSPDAMTPRELAQKYPTRTFLIDGTDPIFEAIKDDLVYAEGGPTAETVMEAINENPLRADDLREWYAHWLLASRPTATEIAETPVDEALVERSLQYVKGLMRGIDSARSKAVSRASS